MPNRRPLTSGRPELGPRFRQFDETSQLSPVELVKRAAAGDSIAQAVLDQRYTDPPEEGGIFRSDAAGKIIDYSDLATLGLGAGSLLAGAASFIPGAAPVTLPIAGALGKAAAATAVPGGIARAGRFITDEPEDRSKMDLGLAILDLGGPTVARKLGGAAFRGIRRAMRPKPPPVRGLLPQFSESTLAQQRTAVQEAADRTAGLRFPRTPPPPRPPRPVSTTATSATVDTTQRLKGTGKSLGASPVTSVGGRSVARAAAQEGAEQAATPAAQAAQVITERVAAVSPQRAQLVGELVQQGKTEEAAKLVGRGLRQAQRLSDKDYLAKYAFPGTPAHARMLENVQRWSVDTGIDFNTLPLSTQHSINRMFRESQSVMDDFASLAGQFGKPIAEEMKDIAFGRAMATIRLGRQAVRGATSPDTQVLSAISKLGQGQHGVRVRLADLRAQLPGVKNFDEKLLQLERAGKVSLYQLDDPLEIAARDSAAAIDVLGNKRHIVYLREPFKAETAVPRMFRSAAELEDALSKVRKQTSEIGIATSDLLVRMAGGGIGGVAGAEFGDTPEEKALFAVLGAVGGASLPSFFPNKSVRQTLATKSGKFADVFNEISVSNMLNSFGTISKAGLGAMGGLSEHLALRTVAGFAEGIASGGKDISKLTGVWKALIGIPGDIIKFGRAVASQSLPELTKLQDEVLTGLPTRVPQMHIKGLAGEVLGFSRRMMAFGDMVAVSAGKRAKFSAEEMAAAMLSGRGSTKTGEQVIRGLTPSPSDTGALKILKRGFAPIPRIGVKMFEEGLRRTPAVVLNKTLRSGGPGNTKSVLERTLQAGEVLPLLLAGQAMNKQGGEVNPEASLPVQAIQKMTDPRFRPLLHALSGPGAALSAAGDIFAQTRRQGGSPMTGLSKSIEESLPFGRSSVGTFTDPARNIPRRLVPAFLGDIAAGLDPAYGRETGRARLQDEGASLLQQTLAPAQAEIPFLRERLPETTEPHTAFGEPKLGRFSEKIPQGLERFLFPTPADERLRPTFDLQDPLAAALDELDIQYGPPDKGFEIGGVDLDLPPEVQTQLQKVRGEARRFAAERVLNAPSIKAMPNTLRKQLMVKALISLGMQRSQQEVARILKEANLERPNLDEPIR